MRAETIRQFLENFAASEHDIARLVGCTAQFVNKCKHKGLTRGRYLSNLENVINFPQLYGIVPRSPDSGKKRMVSKIVPPAQLLSAPDDWRELVRGQLSKDAAFRLMVTGKIGSKEIERLIERLRLEAQALSED